MRPRSKFYVFLQLHNIRTSGKSRVIIQYKPLAKTDTKSPRTASYICDQYTRNLHYIITKGIVPEIATTIHKVFPARVPTAMSDQLCFMYSTIDIDILHNVEHTFMG